MSAAVQIAIAIVIFLAGGAGGIKYQLGVQARIELAAASLRASEAKRQLKVIDNVSSVHVAALAKINNQLGDAREKIASLSGRECFSDSTTGVLNTVGSEPVRAVASQSEGAPPASAPGSGLRYTTDRDAASAIALCRAKFAEVNGQLNQILDIEDARNSGGR